MHLLHIYSVYFLLYTFIKFQIIFIIKYGIGMDEIKYISFSFPLNINKIFKKCQKNVESVIILEMNKQYLKILRKTHLYISPHFYKQ